MKRLLRILILLLLLIAILSGVLMLIMSDTSKPQGISVGLTECYDARDGWQFCNSFVVSTIGHVTIYHNGEYVKTLFLVVGFREEYQGYLLTYYFYDLYVDPQ